MGNTPAYAGKTPFFVLFAFVSWKHPRLRGEDPETVTIPPNLSGNTPAYAGKTGSELRASGRGRKHPRLRGEDWQ